MLKLIKHMLYFSCTKRFITLTTQIMPTAFQVEEEKRVANGIDNDRNVEKLSEENTLNEDISIYASLLQGCIDKKNIMEGKIVHTHIIHRGFDYQDIFLDNTLVTMYAKCGSPLDARKLFDEMPIRNAVSCTVMIAAYARQGYGEEALDLFCEMQRAKIQPTKYTFVSVLPACGALQHGKEIHEEIIRRGFEDNMFIGSALINMYVKCGNMKDARQVFDKMSERDVVCWNAMVAGYAMNGCIDDAIKLFGAMVDRNVVSWNALIAGLVQNGYFHDAHDFFQIMPERDVVSITTMIVGYAQNGHVNEALKLFLKMTNRNVILWNAMIAGFAQSGRFCETLELFRKMKLAGMKPDLDTFSCVLQACANLAALHFGKEVHEDIRASGFQSDVYVGTALVDMYAKCGSIVYARDVFDTMVKRDVASWNAMIAGYAMHGHGREALEIFEQMQFSNTIPNQGTFVGVLSACCHSGLLEEGWKYFNSMSHHYHFIPQLEHYCCMVDLLGRAGHLYEALDFINKIPMRPDTTIWRSLLAACRIHSNVEIGEQVAEHLFKLDPTNSATYVLLSNIYTTTGRWDDSEKLRRLMKERRVEKNSGSSWIEVDNKVHSFVVGDK